MLALFGILTAITIPMVYASEDGEWTDWQEETEINVSLIGNSIIDLDSTELLLRAYVEIINFDPRDGYYFMQIVQPITGKTIAEQEILIREKGNDQAGADVAYMINEDDLIENGTSIKGNYEIKIISQHGSSIGSTTFSVIKPSEPEIDPNIENALTEQSNQDTSEDIATTEIESDENLIEELQSTPEIDEQPKIPEWVRNLFILYAESSITEDELLGAIKFLIEQEIIIV